MIGGTCQYVMIRWLTMPKAPQHARPRTTANGQANDDTSIWLVARPPSVNTAPAEKSSPPPMISSAAPQPTTK